MALDLNNLFNDYKNKAFACTFGINETHSYMFSFRNPSLSDINECASNPCRNGANCADLVNEYECTCQVGWLGTNCDIGKVKALYATY